MKTCTSYRSIGHDTLRTLERPASGIVSNRRCKKPALQADGTPSRGNCKDPPLQEADTAKIQHCPQLTLQTAGTERSRHTARGTTRSRHTKKPAHRAAGTARSRHYKKQAVLPLTHHRKTHGAHSENTNHNRSVDSRPEAPKPGGRSNSRNEGEGEGQRSEHCERVKQNVGLWVATRRGASESRGYSVITTYLASAA